MSLKSETKASEKADAEDEASHPLSRLPATPITAQPVPSHGLWALNDDHELTVKGGMLGPRKIISTSNWPSEIAILGPE